MGLLLFIFFTAFTFLEASLPSLISKRAPAGSKGTAMGVYSSSQFFGIFIGGIVGGSLFAHFGLSSIFFACGLLCVVWFALAFTMQEPGYLATKSITIGAIAHEEIEHFTAKLKTIPGVSEVLILAEEGIAHLKVDNKILDKEALEKFSV